MSYSQEIGKGFAEFRSDVVGLRVTLHMCYAILTLWETHTLFRDEILASAYSTGQAEIERGTFK